MIPATFDYVRPGSVEEALAALADPEAKALAGGHSLLPMMKLRLARPTVIVDIGGLDLKGSGTDGDVFRVGALTTYAELIDSLPGTGALRDAASRVGDLQVRNAGTVGGGVAHGDPASDVTAAVLALGATLRVQGLDGEREIPAEEFFQGPFTTALGSQELLTELLFPIRGSGYGSAYESVEDPASGYPLAGAAARVQLEGDRVAECAIGVTGVASTPFRATAVEEAVVGGRSTREAAATALAGVQATSDTQADAEYRRHLGAVVIERAVERALQRARGGS